MHVQQRLNIQSDTEEDQEVSKAPYVDSLLLSGGNQPPHRSVSQLIFSVSTETCAMHPVHFTVIIYSILNIEKDRIAFLSLEI